MDLAEGFKLGHEGVEVRTVFAQQIEFGAHGRQDQLRVAEAFAQRPRVGPAGRTGNDGTYRGYHAKFHRLSSSHTPQKEV